MLSRGSVVREYACAASKKRVRNESESLGLCFSRMDLIDVSVDCMRAYYPTRHHVKKPSGHSLGIKKIMTTFRVKCLILLRI